MITSLWQIFCLYRSSGLIKSFLVVVRISILPFWKIDKLLPKNGTIIDVGCGAGGLSNYLYFANMDRKIIGIDLSKNRITRAKKTIRKDRDVNFIYGDILKSKLPSPDAYLVVDVLHHIKYFNQEKILRMLSMKLRNGSSLIIKEVNSGDFLPFIFSRVTEKILYPKEFIYTRTKKEWLNLFKRLNLKCKIFSGAFYFPDSTLIFQCSRKKILKRSAI